MNRLNFIKIVALTAISSTIFSNSINDLSGKTYFIIPNVCSNRTFDIDFNKHIIKLEEPDCRYINWQNCCFCYINMPSNSSIDSEFGLNNNKCLTISTSTFYCLDNMSQIVQTKMIADKFVSYI